MRPRTILVWTLMLASTSACPLPEPVRKQVEASLAVDEHGDPRPGAPPEILNDYASDLDDAGKREEALRFYDAALERYAENDVDGRSVCLFNKGLTLRRMSRWQESVEAYAAAYALQPSRGIAINISIPLSELGRVDEAIAYLDRELVELPNDIGLVETKATTLIEAGRTDEAHPVVVQALAIREASGRRADQRYIASWRGYLAEHGSP